MAEMVRYTPVDSATTSPAAGHWPSTNAVVTSEGMAPGGTSVPCESMIRAMVKPSWVIWAMASESGCPNTLRMANRASTTVMSTATVSGSPLSGMVIWRDSVLSNPERAR